MPCILVRLSVRRRAPGSDTKRVSIRALMLCRSCTPARLPKRIVGASRRLKQHLFCNSIATEDEIRRRATHDTPVYAFTLVPAVAGPGDGGSGPGAGGGGAGTGPGGAAGDGSTRPAGADRDLPDTGSTIDPLLLLAAAGLVGLGAWLLRRRAVS